MKHIYCGDYNCKGSLNSTWHRIKCSLFSIGGRKGLCPKWCHERGTSTQPCYHAFHRFSSNQIYFNNRDEKLRFKEVPCRFFEFKIRLKWMDPSKHFPTLFLFDPFYFVVLFLLLLFLLLLFLLLLFLLLLLLLLLIIIIIIIIVVVIFTIIIVIIIIVIIIIIIIINITIITFSRSWLFYDFFTFGCLRKKKTVPSLNSFAFSMSIIV